MAVACACAWASSGAGAASGGSTVVGAEVLPSTILDMSACRGDAALDLGSAPVATWSIGAPCTVTFGSSNETARLRLYQRDGEAPALESTANTWTRHSGSSSWRTVASGSSIGTAWVAGVGGPGEPSIRFLHTTDGGASWTPQTPCDGRVPVDIEALSDTLAYALTSNSVCRTTDGGATWTTIHTGSGFTRLDMVSTTNGFVVGGSRIYRTTDGTSFSEVHDDTTFNYVGAISGSVGGTVIATARRSQLPTSDYGVIVSTDGGDSWTSTVMVSTPGMDTSGVYGALAWDDDILLAATPRGRWRSTDAGASWTPLSVNVWAGRPWVRSDGAIHINTGGDSIQRSTDAGATWTTLSFGTGVSSHVRQLAGAGMTELWAVGYHDRRLRSTDSGATWTSVSPTKPYWRALVAWNERTWVAAGTNGDAVRTTDAGASTSGVTLGTTRTLYDGALLADGAGLLVGDRTILRSEDLGASWSAMPEPAPNVAWLEAEVDEDGVVWLAGDDGEIASSRDGGHTWTLHTAVPGTPQATALDVWDGTIWIGNQDGTVWRASTSSGAALTWSSSALPQSNRVNGLWAIDATTAVALTEYDVPSAQSWTFRTTDAGASWNGQPVAGVTHARELAVADGQRVAWLAASSTLARSDDRGVSWTSAVSSGAGGYLTRVAALNGGRLVAVGEGSIIVSSVPTSGVPDGMAGADAGFGACLETAPGAGSTGWTLAGTGNCTAGAPAGVWSAIAATAADGTARIADTAAPGTVDVGLRFALRTGTLQRATGYVAGLVFEVVAPAA